MNNLEEIKSFVDNFETSVGSEAYSVQNQHLRQFNVFTIISDIYYRENFHSDLIAAFLNPDYHNNDHTYVANLIHLVNLFDNISIDTSSYQQKVTVEREVGRRDITIKTADKRAILIENKINDAGDTYNQIPTYVQQLNNENYQIDAIIYLTLNQMKEPDQATWNISEEERIKIKNKIVSIRAFDGTTKDLYRGWIEKCILNANNQETKSILIQYKQLLRHLTSNHMDLEYFTKFKNYLVQNDNAKTLLAIQKSANEFPEYILNRISNHFKQNEKFKPFKAIKQYSRGIHFLERYQIEQYSFNSDIIITDLYSCRFDFSVRDQVAYEKIYPETILTTIRLLDRFKWNGTRFEHHFTTTNFLNFENDVIEFIENFLSLLNQHQEAIKSDLRSIQML
jgi:hypothetical protein